MEFVIFAETTMHLRQRNFFLLLAPVYLVMPNLVFLCLWVKPWIGVPVGLAVAAGLFALVRKNYRATEIPGISVSSLFWILAGAFGWTLLAGVGGYAPQGYDYLKHNLLFHDLISQPWPVKYESASQCGYLCYGLGYYLLPALGGRWLGESALNPLTVLWTFAGVALFLYWIAAAGTPWKRVFVFLLFFGSGAFWDLFLQIIFHHSPAGGHSLGEFFDVRERMYNLGLSPDYSSFVGLQYRPQHTLTGWIGGALLYDLSVLGAGGLEIFFVWVACIIWSPLTCLGLAVIPLVKSKNLFHPLKNQLVYLAGSGGLLIVTAVYFQGHNSIAGQTGPAWNFSRDGGWLPICLLYVFFQLILFLLLLLSDLRTQFLGHQRSSLSAGIIVLAILPFYKIGFYNDLKLQASIPALLLVALASTRCLKIKNKPSRLLTCVVLLQVAGLTLSASKWWGWFSGQQVGVYAYERIVLTTGQKNISEISEPHSQFDVAAQYLGRTNSIAAKWMLR